MDRETIERVIATLKQIDVRGFESMDKLVGLVMLFTGILAQMNAEKENENGTE